MTNLQKLESITGRFLLVFDFDIEKSLIAALYVIANTEVTYLGDEVSLFVSGGSLQPFDLETIHYMLLDNKYVLNKLLTKLYLQIRTPYSVICEITTYLNKMESEWIYYGI